jgi:glycosyltransferase involved in cell wall biosynthesis
MNSPRISIIVPSYNHARFVDQCVASVLAQSFEDWEMIVVDDGSADDSVERFRAHQDPRIKVYQNEKNLGTYGTQNRAVSLANSDLIAVLNSDDFWHPAKLERQWEAMERCPDAPFCFTLGWKTDEGGIPDTTFDNHGDWPTNERAELMPFLLEQNNLLASSVIFRKPYAAFDESLRYSGDWIAAFEAAYAMHPVCVPERLTYWRQHGTNSSQVPIGVTGEEIRVRRAFAEVPVRQWYVPFVDGVEVRHRVGRCSLHLSALYLLWGNRAAALRSAGRAMRWMKSPSPGLKRLATLLLPKEVALKRLFPGTDVRPCWSDWRYRELELKLRRDNSKTL